VKSITYLIYIVLYESLILGGCGYAVFVLGHSGWWFVLAVFMSIGATPTNKWAALLNSGAVDKQTNNKQSTKCTCWRCLGFEKDPYAE